MLLKRILSVVVTVAIVASGMPGSVKASEPENRKLIKSEIGVSSLKMAEGYTSISTISDLMRINSNPSGNYILTGDIDMSEETMKGGAWDSGNGWTPLNEFSGTLDGNGHRIIGMHIYGTLDRSAGLFSGLTGKGTVKNLGMVDVDINVDKINKDTIYDSVGAIAGYMDECDEGEISNCFVTGKVKKAEDNIFVGGLIGIIGDYSVPTLKNCYNAATVSGNGLVGYTPYDGEYYNDYIVNCYNIGSVTDYPLSDCGYHKGNFKNSYALAGSYQKMDYDYGVVTLTAAQMRLQSSYSGFNFSRVWEIDPYSLYHYPQLQNTCHERVESLELLQAPKKLEYDQGETISVDGAAVKICYEGGHEEYIEMSAAMLKSSNTSKLGEQNIYVSYRGASTYFTIKVNAIPIEDIDIGSENITVEKGESKRLSDRVKPSNATDPVISFSSSNPDIAQINEKGEVTGVEAGTTTITVTATNTVSTVSKEYTVSVIIPCKLLILEQKEQSMYQGEKAQLSVSTVIPADTTDALVWKSSNRDIVDVDEKGNLMGITPGTAMVTVKAGSIEASCSVTVNVKIENFFIVGVRDEAYTGKAITQEVYVTDGNNILAENQDYQLSYQDNIEPGTAKVVVTGIGYYVGSISEEFSIIDESADTEDNNTGGDSQNTGDNNTGGDSQNTGDNNTGGDSQNAGDNNTGGDSQNTGDNNAGGNSQNTEDNNAGGNSQNIGGSNTGDGSQNTEGNNTGGDSSQDIGSNKQSAGTKKTVTLAKVKISSLKNMKGNKMKLKFKKVNGANCYEIRYAIKPNMNGKKLVKIKNTTYTIKLLKKKKYYVQVRAVYTDRNGSRIYGKWSDKKSVEIRK